MAKLVERKPLNWAEKTYIPQVIAGLKTTLRNMFRPTVTLQYPEERPAIPSGYRGVPTLVKDNYDREKCVSCQLCEFICPPKAIRIAPGHIDEDSEHAHVEKAPKEFDINMLRCIYCGLCEEVCPEDAIVLQNTYSVNGESREELIFNKDTLYDMGGNLPDEHLKWDKKLEAEKKGNPHH